MKKLTKLSISLFMICLTTMNSYSQQAEPTPVKLSKLSDNLYEVLEGSGSRGGAYIGDNGILLIDTKMNQESVDQTLAELKKITDLPVKYVINTHSDGDHIMGNRYLPESVVFIAHENCRNEFFYPGRDNSPSEWNNPELLPYVPSVTFKDQMDIYLGEKKVELYYFGVGHTTGDAVVYFPEEKVAFLGDQVFNTRPQLIHSYKGGNSFEHVETLNKMLNTLDAERFCSGHSEVLNRKEIKDHINQVKSYQDKVKSLVAENKSLDEVKNSFGEDEARLVETIFNEVR